MKKITIFHIDDGNSYQKFWLSFSLFDYVLCVVIFEHNGDGTSSSFLLIFFNSHQAFHSELNAKCWCIGGRGNGDVIELLCIFEYTLVGCKIFSNYVLNARTKIIRDIFRGTTSFFFFFFFLFSILFRPSIAAHAVSWVKCKSVYVCSEVEVANHRNKIHNYYLYETIINFFDKTFRSTRT